MSADLRRQIDQRQQAVLEAAARRFDRLWEDPPAVRERNDALRLVHSLEQTTLGASSVLAGLPLWRPMAKVLRARSVRRSSRLARGIGWLGASVVAAGAWKRGARSWRRAMAEIKVIGAILAGGGRPWSAAQLTTGALQLYLDPTRTVDPGRPAEALVPTFLAATARRFAKPDDDRQTLERIDAAFAARAVVSAEPVSVPPVTSAVV